MLRREGDLAVVADAFDELVVSAIPDEVRVGDQIEAEIDAFGADGRLPARAVRIVGRDLRSGDHQGEHARLSQRRRGKNLRRRAEILDVVRRFFAARRYLEIETPSLVPSPGLDVHLDAMAIDGGRFLTTSPEFQMKRLLVAGVPRLFQIARCFRKGEVGARHNPEFTMLEWYRAHASMDEMIEETEALLVDVARATRGHAEVVVGERTIVCTPPFERLPIARAFARHGKISEEQALALALSGRDDDQERFFRILVDEVEPALALGPPVVLVDYPITQASLARKNPKDSRVAERFELFVGGVELCNGFGELVDEGEQRARFEHDRSERARLGKAVYPIDERFLAALQEGMPPSSGNALGLDRLIAMVLGAQEIGDVMAFPESWL